MNRKSIKKIIKTGSEGDKWSRNRLNNTQSQSKLDDIETDHLLAKSNRILERVNSYDLANFSINKTLDFYNNDNRTSSNQVSNRKEKLTITPKQLDKFIESKEQVIDKELLDNVSRFEWKHWQWLVHKSNFATHIQFCKSKEDQIDDSSSDGVVMISNEQDTMVRNSSPVQSFNDIYNTCEKNESKIDIKASANELMTRCTNTPEIGLYQSTSQKKLSQFNPLLTTNKENEKARCFERYLDGSDSYMHRISSSSSIIPKIKENSPTLEIADYDWCLPIPQNDPYIKQLEKNNAGYGDQIKQETSTMLQRMESLQKHLNSLRSPFRNRRNVSINHYI